MLEKGRMSVEKPVRGFDVEMSAPAEPKRAASTDLFEKCKHFHKANDLKKAGLFPYFKPIQSSSGPEVVVEGRKMIMVGSNNYLGLTQHPHVIERAVKAVEKYGSGCTGSRFLNGTLDLHEELERRLERFMNKEAVVVMSTGFQTNQGVISTIVGKDDVIVSDRQNHASIVDGCRLSFGRTVKYRHNDMTHLEEVLSTVREQTPGAGILIVTDGVFSMEGDVANLPRIVELKKQFGARLFVDDAHGIGVFGAHGRGVAEHFGVEDDVDLIMGTFSKSFASIGGFVAGSRLVIDFIQHLARALVFSASMPPAAVAGVIGALDVIESEPERRQRLWANASRMKRSFQELGLNTGNSSGAIVPMVIGEDLKVFQFWRTLFDAGLFTNPVITPAVAPGEGMIRTSYMATHTDEILDRVLEIVRRCAKEFGLV